MWTPLLLWSNLASCAPEPLDLAPVPVAAPLGASVTAWQGRRGGLVRVSGAELEGLRISVRRGGAWSVACVETDRCYLAGPVERVEVSAPGWRSGPILPEQPGIALGQGRSDGGWWADETAELDLALDPLPAGLSAFLARGSGRGKRWWSPVRGTWGARPQALSGVDALPEPSAEASAPMVQRYEAVLGVLATGWTLEAGAVAGPVLVIEDSTTDLVLLSRRWMWGDVHAHSDLSHDGCSNPDEGCVQTADTVGLGFFEPAIDAGLDFAAMSDHAEWTTWRAQPDAPVEEDVDVWTRQHEVVAAAAESSEAESSEAESSEAEASEAESSEGASGFVPLLAYEWTATSLRPYTDGYWIRGHRTVLFEDTVVCDAARISSGEKGDDMAFTKGTDGSLLLGSAPYIAETRADLVLGLDEAVSACGLTQRISLIAHHPALLPPGPIDWSWSGNSMDPRYESLVEIYSEHGSSECLDTTVAPCDWRSRVDPNYLARGSIQSALQNGHRFGIVGGSDSHDSRPGTILDAPSCTAILDESTGELRCQDWKGGLTGAMVRGTPGRAALFDAFFARNTVATSGPRLPVRAWVRAEDSEGRASDIRLPGDAVDAARALELVVSVEGLLDPATWVGVEIDLVDQDGTLLSTTPAPSVVVDLAPAPGDAIYARLRLAGADGEEERVWLSPWYFD